MIVSVATAPPPRSNKGPRSTLTPMQEIELWSWYCAKRFLGSGKKKAREMGIPIHRFENALERMRRREKRRIER